MPHINCKQSDLQNENSNTKLYYEPFLLDRRCCFKNVFITTDLASSDSMIKPIKLSIPKKPKQINSIDKLNQEDRSETPKQIINSPTNNKQNIINKKNIESPIKNKNDDQLFDEEKIPKIDNKNYRNANLEIKNIQLSKENLFTPIPLGSVSIFHMKIDKKNPTSIVPVENPTEEICHITKESKKRSLIYKIFTNGLAIANVTLVSHDSFYSTAQIGSEQFEISAQIIQKQSKEYKIRLFQAFFPKKDQKIVFNGSSSALLKNDTERIEMEPRLPKMKRGIPVMYFGGRVKKESIQNFILETRNDGCAHFVFGKVDDDTFVGEVYPPLSPIQAISIAVSHFK